MPTLPDHSSSLSKTAMAGIQTGENLEAGTDAETMKEHCLLACSSLLSYILQDHLPRGGPTHSGLGLSTSIINQENVPQSCPQAGLIEAIPHLKVLLLR